MLVGSLLHRRAALAAQYSSCHVLKWLVVLSQSCRINLHAVLCEILADVVSALVQLEARNWDAGGGGLGGSHISSEGLAGAVRGFWGEPWL